MTQKELLYLEDAIGHEQNIIKIIDNIIQKLSDEKLINFMNEENSIHNERYEKLMNLLRGKVNE